MKLGVNVDHVATLRQVRKSTYPEPVAAALIAETAGAHIITVHLREDRRHIQDRDVEILKQVLHIPLNLEMAATNEMVAIAKRIKPHMVTLVPEKRQELTTEGGLDLQGQKSTLQTAIHELQTAGIPVSLFIDPDTQALDDSARLGVKDVELHTGTYADAEHEKQTHAELTRVLRAAAHGAKIGLHVHAGHGLNYVNVAPIAECPDISSLQIGHAIIARAVLVGMDLAIREMLAKILK